MTDYFFELALAMSDNHIAQFGSEVNVVQTRCQARVTDHQPGVGQLDEVLEQHTLVRNIQRHIHSAEIVQGKPR